MSVVDFVMLKAPELFGVTGLPTARFGSDVNYFTGYQAWSADLVNKFADAVAVMEQTGITADDVNALTVEDGRSAMTTMLELSKNAAGAALEALKTGDPDVAFEVPIDIAKQALVAIWAYNSNGVYLHTEGAFARGIEAGRISENEAMQHAWRCAAIFDAIIGMKKKGALKWAGEAKPISGLGLTGGEIVVLIIAGIAGVLVTIGFIYIITQALNQAMTQKKALAQCDKLLEQGKHAEHQKCLQNVLAASNEGLNDLMENVSKAGNVLVWTVAIGLIGLVAVQVAPVIMEKLARREA
jgi:hypothetical protein